MANKRDDMYEDEIIDFDEEADGFDGDLEDDFDEEGKPHPLVTAAVFLGLVVLAAIICLVLWTFTHRDAEEEPANATETVQDAALEETASGEVAEESIAEAPAVEDVVQSEIAGTENAENELVGTESTENIDALDSSENISETVNDANEENSDAMEFTDTSDTVTAKDVTNLRSAPTTTDSENVVAQLLNGETLSRTGINGDTGWSRLEYNGQTVYAVSGYLTTDLGYETPAEPGDPNRITTNDGRVITFSNCDDYVSPKEYVNLRLEPSTSQGNASIHCQIKYGETVHRTGYSEDSGWSRVEYDGQVLYVVSSMVYNVETRE